MATEKQIENKVRLINTLLKRNPEPVTTIDGKTKWNVGTYMYEANGTPTHYTLSKVVSESGAIHSFPETCSRGRSQFLDALSCFIDGIMAGR